jgi:hypothetical protein
MVRVLLHVRKIDTVLPIFPRCSRTPFSSHSRCSETSSPRNGASDTLGASFKSQHLRVDVINDISLPPAMDVATRLDNFPEVHTIRPVSRLLSFWIFHSWFILITLLTVVVQISLAGSELDLSNAKTDLTQGDYVYPVHPLSIASQFHSCRS